MSLKTQIRRKTIDLRSKQDWENFWKHQDLYMKWLELLEGTNPNVPGKVANSLARLGLEPVIDEFGVLEIIGADELPNWNRKMNPMVMMSKIGEYNPGKYTRREQADTLKAATLIWAEAIPNKKSDIEAICPWAATSLIRTLLTFCDFEAFYSRRGVGKTAENIRKEFEQNTFDITEQKFKDKLRNYKGGT